MIADFIASRAGAFVAIGTAACWTVTALSFESAGRRVGSLPVNLIRLVMALMVFALFGLITRGTVLPAAIGANQAVWLLLSGLVGFVIGDMFLFQAFVTVGARLSMLIYSSVPVITAILGRVFLDERLAGLDLVGMGITIAGIVLVVLKAPAKVHTEDHVLHAVAVGVNEDLPTEAPHRLRGMLLAFGGALGQAGGLVLAKFGATDGYDAFSATQIRTIAGIVGFSLLFVVLRKWRPTFAALKDGPAMRRIATGAFFGPFLGVSLGLLAAQLSSTGVAATIMATVPVLIIAPSVFLFGEKATPREVLGAVVAVAGVSLLFI